MSSTVDLPDPRTVTGCGLHVLGLRETSASGVFAYLCTYYVLITYVCTYLRGAPAGRHLSASSTPEEYLDERVRKTTDYAYST